MKGRLVSLGFFLAMAFQTNYGQISIIDTIDIPSEKIISGFNDNLDSLLNLWYVEQQLSIDDMDVAYLPENDTLLPDYPDSVYIERLQRLPFVVDMTYNKTVSNFIKLYTNKRRERVRVMLNLSNYYFPLFEEIFDRYQIPYELKYMAVIESALNPRAVSSAGATGMWQFMYYTARHYGLTVNSLVDERRDPYMATIAAAEFMADLYKMYNDWTLVIAAYNCGPGNVNKAIRRAGGKRNYWDIYYYLPRETRGYVPAFIAAAYVMNYADSHNLKPIPVDFALNNDTVHIFDKLHLKQVSDVLNIPMDQLRDLNPQYKNDIIPNDKEYVLRLPKENIISFIDLKDSVFNYQDSVFFNNNNHIINPTALNNKKPVLPSDKYTALKYTVQSGDNLGYISMWYDVRLSDLRYWNNIRSNTIRAGEKLIIYVPNSKAEYYQPVDKLSFTEKQKRIGKTVVQTQSSPALSEGSKEEYVTYKVKSGDSLWEIAKKFPGVSDNDISQLNNLNYGSTIQPGQILKIKKKI
ncbi:MAG: transglycosylase SLT domain-containing protein [Bacteroidales bacterium]|nr:transglycosylase SLT domain-containing protein [Bacteroidales bacterium]MCF8390774.1 transglycosylase SLT domain-containing protein [Bacteroidales bacterium]